MPGDLQELGGGWLAALITSVGLGGTAIYKAFRKVREDHGEDVQAGKAAKALDGVIARMEAEIARQNGVIIDLGARVDKMAVERNEAIAKLATAQAEALVLKGKVEALETDVAELKAELVAAEKKLGLVDTGARRRATDYIDDREITEI